MGMHDYPRICMDVHGYAWIPRMFMGIHLYSWIFMVIHGHFRDIHGHPWIFMDVHRLFSTNLTYLNIAGLSQQLSFSGIIRHLKDQDSIQDKNNIEGETLLGREAEISYIYPYFIFPELVATVALSHYATADNIWKISDGFKLMCLDFGNRVYDFNLRLFDV